MKRTAKETNKFVTEPGSRWYQKKHGEVQVDGTIVLVDDEVIDIQEKMNAEYASTTIENILANSLPGTDYSDKGSGYMDYTKMPTTLAEFMQFQIDQRNKFDALPAEKRALFNNDVNQFLATAGSEEWMRKLDIIPVVEKPVNNVENSEGEVKE